MTGASVFKSTASDSRLSGTMYVYVTEWVPEDGWSWAYGTYDVVNAGGSWHCDYWYSTYSKGSLVDKPAQAFGLESVAVGAGGYDDMTLRVINHSGGGAKAPFIFKGWLSE